MAYQIRHRAATVTDISDYIYDSNDLPLQEVNRDMSPIISTLNIVIDKDTPITFALDDNIELIENGTFRQSWKIQKYKLNRDRDVYELTLISPLYKLKEKLLNETNLGALITGTSDPVLYRFRDNYFDGSRNISNVQVLWVIERMLGDCGLSLLKTDKTKVVGNWLGYAYTYEDIAIDYAMLFNVNQSIATAPNRIDSIEKYKSSQITYWDFIERVCAFLGIFLRQYELASYQMLSSFHLAAPSISDDVRYSYLSEKRTREDIDGYTDVKYTDRIKYYDNGESELDGNSNTEGYSSNYNWFNNLRFLLRDKSPGAVAGDIVVPESSAWIDPMYNVNAKILEHNLRNAVYRNYWDHSSENEIITDAKKAASIKINIDELTGKIEERVPA